MSNGGLSTTRLHRMHEIMAGHVERGNVPGIVTLISRHGTEHVDALGATALGGSAPIARDTIFRIASMTKPIVAVATMILDRRVQVAAGPAASARPGLPILQKIWSRS